VDVDVDVEAEAEDEDEDNVVPGSSYKRPGKSELTVATDTPSHKPSLATIRHSIVG